MFSKHLDTRLFLIGIFLEKSNRYESFREFLATKFLSVLVKHISQHWAICIISKNHWAINFQRLGSCPMAPPLGTPMSRSDRSVAEACENLDQG